MHRKRMIIMLAFLFIFVGCAKDVSQVSLEHLEVEQGAEEDSEKQDSIYVFVCGAVVNEGVYELPTGSRVFEAIQMAGGPSENAATEQINQAEMLEDGIRLYIPTTDEMQKEQTEEDGKVDINTATTEELMTLPGVGEAKADLIVEYRQEHGRFQRIEDIMNISGIKEGLFGKIKDYIKV